MCFQEISLVTVTFDITEFGRKENNDGQGLEFLVKIPRPNATVHKMEQRKAQTSKYVHVKYVSFLNPNGTPL